MSDDDDMAPPPLLLLLEVEMGASEPQLCWENEGLLELFLSRCSFLAVALFDGCSATGFHALLAVPGTR